MSVCPLFSLQGRTTKPIHFRNLVFWACEGLIVILDHRAQMQKSWRGRYSTITPKEMAHRIKVNFRYATHRQIDEDRWQRQDRQQLINICSKLEDMVADARRMGDPSDPRVQAYWIRHHRNGTVSMAEAKNKRDYPQLPDLPRGVFTGRTAEPGVPVAEMIYTAPKKKNPKGVVLDI